MEENGRYGYRLMKIGEESYVYNLILRVFHEFVAPTYSQEGIDTFLSMLSIDFLKATIPERLVVVAEQDGRIVGSLAAIQLSHIALLFVDTGYQRNGIGRGLIQFCIAKCLEKYPDLKEVTVNSTPNSVSFYESVGFTATGEERAENGLRFVPMRMEIVDYLVNLAAWAGPG